MNRTIRISLVIALCGATMGGCSWFGGKKNSTLELELQAKADRQERLKSYRNNLTPSIRTMADRRTDTANDWAYLKNASRRLLWADVRNSFYTDRPSRLTKYPTTY